MMPVDNKILGFSVTAAPDRINVGDRDYGEGLQSLPCKFLLKLIVSLSEQINIVRYNKSCIHKLNYVKIGTFQLLLSVRGFVKWGLQ